LALAGQDEQGHNLVALWIHRSPVFPEGPGSGILTGTRHRDRPLRRPVIRVTASTSHRLPAAVTCPATSWVPPATL